MDLDQIVSSVQEKEARAGYDSLAPREKVVFAVNLLEAEVNNGGFHQFFFNSESDHVNEVIEALQTIGASRAAAIVRDACALFPAGGPSRERDVRQEELEEIGDEPFEALDERFYAYPDPLAHLLLAHWEKNASA